MVSTMSAQPDAFHHPERGTPCRVHSRLHKERFMKVQVRVNERGALRNGRFALGTSADEASVDLVV
jgi:hypothetical protein